MPIKFVGFGFRFSGFGFRVSGLEFRVSGLGFRISGFWFLVSGFWFLVSGFGIWVERPGCRAGWGTPHSLPRPAGAEGGRRRPRNSQHEGRGTFQKGLTGSQTVWMVVRGSWNKRRYQEGRTAAWKVNIRLPGKGNSTSHGARPL